MKYTILRLMVAVVLVGVGGSAVTAHAMDKAELIEAMASHAGMCGKIDTIDNAPVEKERCFSKADAKKALEGFLEASVAALQNGDRVSLIGFGSFSVSKRAERAEVVFSPEVQSKGAEKRHACDTRTGEEIVKKLSEKCEDGEERKEESCPAYEKMLSALIAVSSDALVRGEFVEWGTKDWGDFGTLQAAMAHSISKRSARTGRNPQTGKEIKIAAKNTVKFKAGAELSKAVN